MIKNFLTINSKHLIPIIKITIKLAFSHFFVIFTSFNFFLGFYESSHIHEIMNEKNQINFE